MIVNSPAESCEIEIRVRYAEVDRMGVVHHSRHWVYFEMGRTELLRLGRTAYRDLEADGKFLVVVSCSAKYRAPARYDDVLILTTRLIKTTHAKIEHAYELRRKSDATLLVTAATTLACVDRDGKVTALPKSLRNP